MRQGDPSMDDLELIEFGEYEEAANEYYDAKLHPTCANFRTLSYFFIEALLSASPRHFSRCLEIGAGRSVLAELRKKGLDRFGQLTISDKSKSMLRHSRDLVPFYDLELLLDVEDVPEMRRVCAERYDLVVASLADPYNGNALWRSLKEIVNIAGQVILTTPSYEWARAFRKESQSKLYDVAEFITSGGSNLYFRSVVFPPDEQISMCYRFDFQIDRLEQIYCDPIPEAELSSKLHAVRRNQLPAVTGYVLVRQ